MAERLMTALSRRAFSCFTFLYDSRAYATSEAEAEADEQRIGRRADAIFRRELRLAEVTLIRASVFRSPSPPPSTPRPLPSRRRSPRSARATLGCMPRVPSVPRAPRLRTPSATAPTQRCA